MVVCFIMLMTEGNPFQEPVKSSFCSEDENVSTAYTDLVTSSKKTLDSLLELQEVCMHRLNSVNCILPLSVLSLCHLCLLFYPNIDFCRLCLRRTHRLINK